MAKKMQITTIQLYENTKKELEKIKLHHRESYDDVIKRLLESELAPSLEEMFERTERLKHRKHTTKEIVKMIHDARENASFY